MLGVSFFRSVCSVWIAVCTADDAAGGGLEFVVEPSVEVDDVLVVPVLGAVFAFEIAVWSAC